MKAIKVRAKLKEKKGEYALIKFPNEINAVVELYYGRMHFVKGVK